MRSVHSFFGDSVDPGFQEAQDLHGVQASHGSEFSTGFKTIADQLFQGLRELQDAPKTTRRKTSRHIGLPEFGSSLTIISRGLGCVRCARSFDVSSYGGFENPRGTQDTQGCGTSPASKALQYTQEDREGQYINTFSAIRSWQQPHRHLTRSWVRSMHPLSGYSGV